MKTLIDKVLEQIKTDIESQDLTAIAEMLNRLPENVLKAYLSE